MATSKIKKGDTVRVITGKDKGREGKVTAVKGCYRRNQSGYKAYKAKSGKPTGWYCTAGCSNRCV